MTIKLSNGMEFTTEEARDLVRVLSAELDKQRLRDAPTFSLSKESTYNLYCSWCKSFVDLFSDPRDEEQAKWEHTAKVHPEVNQRW